MAMRPTHRPQVRHAGVALLLSGLLAGCTASPELPPFPGLGTPDVTTLYYSVPDTAPQDSCWAETQRPLPTDPAAVYQTGPQAIFHAATLHEMPLSGQPEWFRTPCPSEMGREEVIILQRALAARGYYHGQANGVMTARTRAAVLAYQTRLGLPSDRLSLAAARNLGVLAIDAQIAMPAARPARTAG